MSRELDARLAKMAEDFAKRYSEDIALGYARDLWQSDRWSDFTAFARTAALAAEELRRAGLEDVEIVPCPADGRTRMQAWTMPLAWEAGESVLRVVEPVELTVCDRMDEPLSACMWTEPTLRGGVRGPLVVVDNPGAVSPEEREKLRGAILLTSLRIRGEMKVFAHQVGAAAVVSSHVPHAERHVEAVGWSNGWSDDPGAWALKASDCRMTGFQIRHSMEAQLRKLVAGGLVVCEARVGGRVGEGRLPVVTGVVPGESPEEVLLIGHLYEIGALDNASGCAAMMEAVRLMASMPRPRRTVRIVLTSECYGSYALYTLRPNLLGRIVAGLNADCVGEAETEGRPHLWSRTPEAAPAAADTLFRAALRVTETCPGGRTAEESGHGLSDNAMCDPAVGAAVINFMRAPWTWHTSLDDWSQLDPASMRRATVATAVYARWLAEAGPDDADALARAAAEPTEVEAPMPKGDFAPERRAFFVDRARARVHWTKKLGARKADAAAVKLAALDPTSLVTEEDGGGEQQRTVPVRSFWGAPTFDEIPDSDRDGFADPRWNSHWLAACYWADGRRSVAQIAALVRTEFGRPMPDLLRFFRVLERGGLVTLKK